MNGIPEDKAPLVILAAGGTGGHIFPAQALSEAMTARGWQCILLTDERFMKYATGFSAEQVRTIPTGGGGHGIVSQMMNIAKLGMGTFAAWRLLGRLKPAIIVGFGGYPSFPTMLAACWRKIPTIIHEQNSLMGRANAMLVSRVSAVATSFPEVRGLPEAVLRKVTLTGNPVRSAVKAVRGMEYPILEREGILRLLVTGGSQGASVFSEVVPEALALLPGDMRTRIRVDQQCRAENIEAVRARYNTLKVSADVAAFFTDIPARLAGAHLVIGRAGASTIAELTTAGRPAILVPYPQAKDDHQTTNANAVEDAGGGWLIPQASFTAEVLADMLKGFLSLPDRLQQAAVAARELGREHADAMLADMAERLAKR